MKARPATRGRLALRRGATAPAACNRRFVPPAVRRREQDALDVQRFIALRHAFGVRTDQADIDAFLAMRGTW